MMCNHIINKVHQAGLRTPGLTLTPRRPSFGRGAQVEKLHLKLYRYAKPAALNKATMRDLTKSIQLCSATLTSLYLEGLYFGQCFDELRNIAKDPAGAACSTLQVMAELQHNAP